MTASKHGGDDERVVRLLAGAAALVGSVRNCWLITRPDRTVTARPMGVVALENSDHDWKLIFLTDSRSRKSSEIDRTGNVMVIVQREPDEAYATFSGRAVKITDPAVVASRWKEAYGRYFPNEADRSNAIFIEISIKRMELWIRGVTPEPFGFVPAVVERAGGWTARPIERAAVDAADHRRKGVGVMTDRVLLTIAGGVADVRLNRADKMNALDPAMFEAVADTVAAIGKDPSVRAVVLSGEGGAFCAGLDVERMAASAGGGNILPFAGLTDRTHGIANFVQHIVWAWRELPVPVIAAVHGVALGGGFQLALGADMRYVAPGTRLGIIETKWGLVPDMAGTQLMRGLVRDDVIRELTYTARIFSAEEAMTFGFATRLVADPRTAALATAREIAERSPDAIRAAKRLLNQAVSGGAEAILAAETEEQSRLLRSPNHAEAVRAGFEKRAPVFADPLPVSIGA